MANARIAQKHKIGNRYGRLTIIDRPPARKGLNIVICQCTCGDVRQYHANNLRIQSEPMCPPCRTASRPSKGRSKRHPLFNIWKAMIQRCENPKHTWYSRYGGRGIAICERWRNDFDAFAADMGERPSVRHTVDRIDGNKGYEPGNVRWATPAEQQRNRSDTLQIEWEGRTISGKEAADLAGIEVATFYYRLRAGWPLNRIMTTPSTMTTNKGVPKPKRKAA